MKWIVGIFVLIVIFVIIYYGIMDLLWGWSAV